MTGRMGGESMLFDRHSELLRVERVQTKKSHLIKKSYFYYTCLRSPGRESETFHQGTSRECVRTLKE